MQARTDQRRQLLSQLWSDSVTYVDEVIVIFKCLRETLAAPVPVSVGQEHLL